MGLQFIAVKCPECAADLSIEEGRTTAYCTYCGAKIMINNENEYIYRRVDEARIREAEIERELMLKELEIQDKEFSRRRVIRTAGFIIALVFVLVGIPLTLLGEIGYMLLSIGLCIGSCVLAFGGNDNRKRRRYLRPNEAVITQDMLYFEEKNYNSVAALFRSNGFTNVETIPLHDLTFLSVRKNGQVEEVTINGSSSFSDGDVFSKSAKVIVTYHSK